MSRRCGTCQVCCVLPSISLLDKLRDTPCPHLAEYGCSVHDDQPCGGDFVCSWLEGSLPKSAKPSRIGVLVWRSPNGIQVLTTTQAVIHQPTWNWLMKISRRVVVNVDQAGQQRAYRNGLRLLEVA